MGVAQTTNHIGEHQEKNSSQSGSEVLIGGGGGEILLETNLGIGGEPNHYLYSKDQNKKQQEQVSRSEELNFFRKKGEEPKKTKRSLWSHVKVNTNQEKETDERIAVSDNLSFLAL